MGKGAALTEGSQGDNISHFAAIRVRVTGVGQLQMKVLSLDDVKSKTLVPFTLQQTSRIIPTRIVNFMEQRASFEFTAPEIDTYFRINRITIYIKEVYTSYPGN